jgi:hypothetical protein
MNIIEKTVVFYRAQCKKRLSLILSSLLFFPIMSCDKTNLDNSLPELTFTHRPIIQLDVEKIEIINEYKMPFKAPNIEHLVPISPGASAERWASDVLRPVGRTGTAQFVIKKGTFIRENLKIKKGIQGIFSIDQSKRFKGTVEVRLDIFKDQRKAVARASAVRSRTLREDASPNTQARLWYNIVESLMQSFDREMREQVNSHFQKYLK